MKKIILQKKFALLEKSIGCKVLLYFTNELQPPFGTKVANDTLSLFKDILEEQGDVDRRVLILHTNGGNLETAWPLISLLRTYTKKSFEVIVPSKSLSAGTLIALGADKIWMCKGSFLSPIDPTGVFPIEKNGVMTQQSCSVEDIMGFVSFAKEKIGLADQAALSEVLRLVSNQFNPAIIGSVNRTHSLIRSLSEKAIGSRKIKPKIEDKKIKIIAKGLIEDLYSHQHLINLTEAKDLGLTYAQEVNSKWMENIKDLFEYYKKEMFLEEQSMVFQNKLREITSTEAKINISGACVHSLGKYYTHQTEIAVSKLPNQSGAIQPSIEIKSQGWNLLS